MKATILLRPTFAILFNDLDLLRKAAQPIYRDFPLLVSESGFFLDHLHTACGIYICIQIWYISSGFKTLRLETTTQSFHFQAFFKSLIRPWFSPHILGVIGNIMMLIFCTYHVVVGSFPFFRVTSTGKWYLEHFLDKIIIFLLFVSSIWPFGISALRDFQFED